MPQQWIYNKSQQEWELLLIGVLPTGIEQQNSRLERSDFGCYCIMKSSILIQSADQDFSA